MNPQTQTLKFLVAAVVSVLLAWVTWYGTQPTPVEGFGKVGEQFFTELKVNKATALRVAAFDDEQADMDDFIVQKVNGVWQLPGYNNYPADGEDQLGKTAASLVGTRRGALASRQPTDHARLGVVDPEDKSQELEGRGQKITIFKGEDGDLSKKIKMAELIVGNEVPDQTGTYYVRIPDEKETYIASLEIDLSTKFSDWVEDDLLKVDRDKIISLETRSTRSEAGQDVESVESQLTRASSTDDWVLDALNTDSEEVNKDNVRDIVNTADSVKIAGVRIRPKLNDGSRILDGNLQVVVPEDFKQQPPQIQEQIQGQIARQFQSDLQPRGFKLAGALDDLRLLSTSGELIVGTNDGIRYHMVFGDEFEGTEKEIQVGGTSVASDDAGGEEEKPAGPEKEDAADSEDADQGDSELQKSRYLFVRATFDESLLGPALVDPIKPTVPEGVIVDADGNVVEPETPAEPETPPTSETSTTPKPPVVPADPTEEDNPAEPETDDAAPTDADSGEASADDEEATETPETTEAAETPKPADAPEAADTPKPADTPEPADTPKPADAPEPADKPETEDTETPEIFKPDPVEDYKKALIKYRADKAEFDRETADRETKTGEGLETVEELNERFGNWYYVISADDFNKLRLTRDQVVKVKEKPEPEPGDDPPADNPEKHADTPETPEKPAAPSDSTEKPVDAPAPTKPETEKPAEATPPEKPADSTTPAKPGPAPATPEPPVGDSPAKPADSNE